MLPSAARFFTEMVFYKTAATPAATIPANIMPEAARLAGATFPVSLDPLDVPVAVWEDDEVEVAVPVPVAELVLLEFDSVSAPKTPP